MAFQEYASYDGLGLGELVRKGEVTASELLEEAIARVERHNSKINSKLLGSPIKRPHVIFFMMVS